jgi:hypothetical protein
MAGSCFSYFDVPARGRRSQAGSNLDIDNSDRIIIRHQDTLRMLLARQHQHSQHWSLVFFLVQPCLGPVPEDAFGWPKRSRGFERISDRRNLLALRRVADPRSQLVPGQASSPAAEAWLAPRKHDVSVIRDRLQPSSTWPALILRSPCAQLGRY